MPSQKNVAQLQTLKDKLQQAQALIIANYEGLPVEEQNKLRQSISQTQGEFAVAKNNLLRLALKDKLKKIPKEIDKALNGPTAIMFANSDAAPSIKALTSFIKDNQRPQIKTGIMQDRVLSLAEIDQLSQLPSREQLLATLLSQINAPTQSFASVLAAPTRYLVYALNAIKDKRGGGE